MSLLLHAQLEESTLYCGVGIGDMGTSIICALLSNGPLESPAPLGGSRILACETGGFGSLNILVAPETEGILRQNKAYYVS